MNINTRKKGDESKFWIYLALFLYCAFTIFVFSWILMTSFKTNQELYANVWSLPKHLNFGNYIKAWDVLDLKICFLNSVIVGFISTICLNFIAAPAAYVLIRSRLKITRSINTLFVIGLGIPIPIILIPLLTLFAKLGLVDNLIGLIIVYIAVQLPFTVFLLAGFLRSLPIELEEAAIIDGCSYIGSFWKIIFPLATPGLITASIFNFVSIWNEYFIALVFITSESKRTISLGVYSLQTSMLYTANWVGMYAGVIILVIPTVIIFVILSERIIAGMTRGAVKG